MSKPSNFSPSLFIALNFHSLIVLYFIFLSLMLLLPVTRSLNFSFSSFKNAHNKMDFEKDSYPDSDGILQMTKNQRDASSSSSVGRASYNEPLFLWDQATGELTNFSTKFSFVMKQPDNNVRFSADGITFFLAAPFNSSSSPPDNSAGGCLGLVNGHDSCNVTVKDSPFVAIEFDTYPNSWDQVYNSHVGIGVNSVVSVVDANCDGLENGSRANAHITYDSTMNLSVYLTYANHSLVFLSHIIDLRTVLPQMVRVGFSASTGATSEIHNIFSWEFNSTLVDTRPSIGKGRRRKSKGVLVVVGVVASVGLLIIIITGVVLVGFKRKQRRSNHQSVTEDSSVCDDIESGTGPKRYTYHELSCATNNFNERQKLGEGGFGGVYFGILLNSSTEIAVKKVSRGSKQGKKEFVSELKIISKLRHKNLVQLLGWCHENGDFLLVYEFMPNGSLDSHLYGGYKDALSWKVRYKIALGLASALFYLHEEWEQCVVHRDIKSSNIMLDSNFNAKLGDFGLARLVDHELGSQTTVLAGTFGYLAPECTFSGKASKESDVYSFGVVALEIVCGRRPIEIKEEASKVRMVEWVWGLYGNGLLLEAIDRRLEGEFDVYEAECLMMAGLWCCHPDLNLRPSMSQVISVLKLEASLPILPSKFPVPVYFSPPMVNIDMSSFPSSSWLTGSSGTGSSSTQLIVSGNDPVMFSI